MPGRSPKTPRKTDTLLNTGQRSWVFDAEVSAVYDDMLQRSIPDYVGMRQAVTALACRFARPATTILDLGCAQGGAIAPILTRLGGAVRFLGVDTSVPMLDEARLRFHESLTAGLVDFATCDLRSDYPHVEASVTLAILTLQFVPLEHRQRLMQQVFDHTVQGGVCIMVEKVLGATAQLDEVMVENYYASKAANGYSQEQIQAKRHALEGILVPLTARWNEDLLRDAGFTAIDCFWRWMNFAGWIGVKA